MLVCYLTGMSKFFRLYISSVFTSEAFRSHAGWVGLLLLNLLIVVSLRNQIISPKVSSWVPQLVLNLYLLVAYVYGQLKIKAVERYDFMQLIWKMLLFGFVSTCFSFFLESVLYLFSGSAFAFSSFISNVFYLCSLLLISTYLIVLLIAYKRLILYEKSKVLLIVWRIFEYSLIAGMVLGVFNIRIQSFLYDGFLVGLIGMGVVLSVNLKWVGYLDFSQKCRSLLMLAGIAGFLSYFCFFIYIYSEDKGIYLNLADNIFVLALLAFCLFYSLLSGVVLFFNLPTSSVYEKKLQEIKGFQKLNRKSQNEESKETLLAALLENALSSIDADSGWVELKEQAGEVLITGEKLEEEELNSILEGIKRNNLKKVFAADFSNPAGEEYFTGSIAHSLWRSVLVVPLTIQESHAGLLVLLKDIEGGFNKDAIEVVKTYADHACVSVENMYLMQEALQNERYKEELAIARRVQRSLLPEQLEHNKSFDLAVYSESTDEVGGDYYDSYKVNEHQFVLIIGDVAGHGTSAAFAMSQLKGVFHSLVPLGFPAREFVVRVNDALSKCLGKAIFITLTYVIIDTDEEQVKLVRAGHCPALYFRKKEKDFLAFESRGMGIGILRDSGFAQHLEENRIKYEAGDLLVLYTDGLTECKDNGREEFGMERLREVVKINADKDVTEIRNAIIDELTTFAGKGGVNDDLTVLIVKFN